MNEITIRSLAKELNLSIGTVSKALRDSFEISDETKKKVFDLAKKHNYIPNPYASSLRRKKSNTIGVVIPEVADSFFSHAIKGIELVAQQKGYHVLIYLTYESLLKEEAIIKDFTSGRVDGVLMSISSETNNSVHIHDLQSKGIPLVFFDRVCEEMHTAKIVTDDFESGYKATKHLIDCGCKNIMLLSISNSLSISNRRLEGYEKALADHGRKSCSSNIIHCGNDDKENYAIIREALNSTDRPDGLIATVEKLITPVYEVVHHLHLSVPRQLKIIGFSNLPSASILDPSLTTISQPAFEMGQTAAAVLFGALAKNIHQLNNEDIVLPSLLIPRRSTQVGL
jgi:LacI family transcriptional regulator